MAKKKAATRTTAGKRATAKQRAAKRAVAPASATSGTKGPSASRSAAKAAGAAKDALLAAAQALKPKEVGQLRFELLTAKKACRDGLARLDKHRALLARDYAGFDLAALDALPELCDRALAQQRIVQLATRAAALSTVLPPALAWRRKLLRLAESFAEDGAIDGKALAAIERGSGPSDNVQDVLDLVKLLAPLAAKVDAVHGPGALAAAQAAGEAGLAALGAGNASPAEVTEAAELRDRYATLIVLRHDRLRAAVAAVTSYAEATTLVPGLSSGRPAKASAPGAPAPPATAPAA